MCALPYALLLVRFVRQENATCVLLAVVLGVAQSAYILGRLSFVSVENGVADSIGRERLAPLGLLGCCTIFVRTIAQVCAMRCWWSFGTGLKETFAKEQIGVRETADFSVPSFAH